MSVSDVESGALAVLQAQTSQVKNGANLLVTQAPNKGMVGLGCRYDRRRRDVFPLNCEYHQAA